MIAFFDTNILVYCSDQNEPKKRKTALALVEQYSTDGLAVISTQVLIELFNVLINKQRVPKKSAAKVVDDLSLWRIIDSDLTLVQQAVARTAAQPISIWDAMIVEAAMRANASILFSEDLAAGQRYGQTKVINPFVMNAALP